MIVNNHFETAPFLSGKKNLFPERKAEREEHERGERALCGAA